MFITVRVYPNATKNEVVGFSDGVWLVKISAQPVKGEANKELISFFGEVLGLGRRRLSINRGHTSHSKVIAIDGLTQEEIMTRLSDSISR